jgi:FMN-dependent NADH-azoreductase
MPSILYVTCSPRGEHSESGRLANKIISLLLKREPAAEIVLRSIGGGLPSIDAGYATALGESQPSTAELSGEGSFSLSEELIRELESASYLVIGTPMHNFTVPSTLKGWLDHIVRVRRTFRFAREGKIPSLADRPVFVAVSSGGWLSGPHAHQPDFLTPYLKAILATIGLRDLTFFSIEGTGAPVDTVAATRAAVDRALSDHFAALPQLQSEQSAERRHLDLLLDDGLRQTFPASDPIAPYIDEHRH